MKYHGIAIELEPVLSTLVVGPSLTQGADLLNIEIQNGLAILTVALVYFCFGIHKRNPIVKSS